MNGPVTYNLHVLTMDRRIFCGAANGQAVTFFQFEPFKDYLYCRACFVRASVCAPPAHVTPILPITSPFSKAPQYLRATLIEQARRFDGH